MNTTTAPHGSTPPRENSQPEVPYGMVPFWWSNLLFIIREQLWLLLVTIAVVGVACFASYHVAPRVYVSKAIFMVDQSPFEFTGKASTGDDTHLLVEGILSSVQNQDMREIVADRLGLPSGNIFMPDADGKSPSLKTPRSVSITSSAERSSRVATIEADSTDPQLAADAANAVLDELSVLNRLAGSVDSTNEQMKVVEAEIASYGDALSAADADRIALEQKLNGIKEHRAAGGSLASNPAFANDPGLLELVKKRIDADAAYHAQAQFSVRGEQLAALRGQEEDVESQMASYLNDQRIGLESAYREVQDKILALQASLKDKTDALTNLRSQKATLIQAVGNFKLRQQLFAGKSDGNEAGVIVALDRAVAALRPAKPSRLLYVAIAVALCAVIAPALMFLRHSLDQRIRSPLQIEWSTGFRCLAVLPETPDHDGPLETGAFSGVSFLRNQMLRQSAVSDAPEVFAFTDIGGADGGRWLAFLGCMMAQAGKPTLLIDLDFEKPSLNAALDLKSGSGLSEWVESDEPISSFVTKTGRSNLGLIQPGGRGGDLDIALSRRPLAPHLAQLQKNWPFIFIYAPPLARTANLLLAAPQGCAVVALAAYNHAQLGELRDEIAQCECFGFRFAGVILHQYPLTSSAQSTSRLGSHRYVFDPNRRAAIAEARPA